MAASHLAGAAGCAQCDQGRYASEKRDRRLCAVWQVVSPGPRTQRVQLRVVALRGVVVASLHVLPLAGGSVRGCLLDGTAWPSGVYLVRASAGGGHATSARVMLVK